MGGGPGVTVAPSVSEQVSLVSFRQGGPGRLEHRKRGWSGRVGD